jgi:hypothetical protein
VYRDAGSGSITTSSSERIVTLNAQPLWDWIQERHRIYLEKAAGAPPPWTTDEIMQTYRFCNVFRELDKVTVWVR